MSLDLVVYGVPGSPYLRSALLGLEEKGLPYRLAEMGMGTSKTPEHLARNPFGRIPVIDHGGFQLYETQAILRYIDILGTTPSLQPTAPKASARMNQVMGIVDWYFFPNATVGICAERFFAQAFWKRPPDEANIMKALPAAKTCISELHRLLGDSLFMAGEHLSLADLMLAPQLEYFRATPEGTELLKATPLDGWLTRMGTRASMQATQAERLKNLKGGSTPPPLTPQIA
jgi:glutathione S-transferase